MRFDPHTYSPSDQGRMTMKAKLIAAGVNNLRTYGYPGCDKENILTDPIYTAFFVSMLKDNIGKGGDVVDAAIGELLAKCESRMKSMTATPTADTGD
jgi:hypothetical protein